MRPCHHTCWSTRPARPSAGCCKEAMQASALPRTKDDGQPLWPQALQLCLLSGIYTTYLFFPLVLRAAAAQEGLLRFFLRRHVCKCAWGSGAVRTRERWLRRGTLGVRMGSPAGLLVITQISTMLHWVRCTVRCMSCVLIETTKAQRWQQQEGTRTSLAKISPTVVTT